MLFKIKKAVAHFNWGVILNLIGLVLLVEAALMLLPFIVSLIYKETSGICFLITAAASTVIGFPLSMLKPTKSTYFAKDGMLGVGLCWLVVSLVGALPFYLSNEIPSYIDCFFETVSGFTTTGSSILTNVEALSYCMIFWRSFTHWVGGMGVLVFVLAIFPKANDRTMHFMRAEAPGPVIGKLVPRLQQSAMILYLIYIVMTIIEIILLLIAGMPLFDALCNSFGSAGTGGFAIKNSGFAYYENSAIHWIVAIFVILFGVNFNIYYYMLIKEFKSALSDQELHTYFGIIIAAIALITLNIYHNYNDIFICLRDVTFQVASIITTTGYSSVDFNLWPTFSKIILFLLMFIGASAGSTGGGIKVSRIMIIYKKIRLEIQKIIHPNKVSAITMNGKVVADETVTQTLTFFGCYMILAGFFTLIVALDNFDMESTISSVIACLSNIGPGFGICGAYGNFASFSVLSKVVLSLAMLLGRLELYPILIMCFPFYSDPKIKKRIIKDN